MSHPLPLEILDVSVAYGKQTVVRDIQISLQHGEIGCLLGPSGCGKSTLLRAIAGFEPVAAGEIRIHGEPASRVGWHLPPERRQIGMVFQDFALFPHLTVAENIAFGLRHQPAPQRRERVAQLLRLVNLEEASKQHPHQLSGGQQQRIALIRAMAPRPRILLLDEPFSSMDVELREQLACEVRDLLKQDGITAILVTHDQMEAFNVADRVAVLREGRMLQWDTPYTLYHAPVNRFVAEFVGQGVLLPGVVKNEELVKTDLGVFRGGIPAFCQAGCPVYVLLRPDDIVHDDYSPLRAEIVAKRFRGSDYLYTLKLASGTEVLCLVPSHHVHQVHDSIGIHLNVEHLVVFPAKTER